MVHCLSAGRLLLPSCNPRLARPGRGLRSRRQQHDLAASGVGVAEDGWRDPMTDQIREAVSSTTNLPNKVAIVGGGIAGLSTAFYLARFGVAEVDVFDASPPGKAKASSVAGGLLHPLTPRNRLIWKGLEGFAATRELMGASKRALLGCGGGGIDDARRLHSSPGGILRPALTEQHVRDYQQAAKALPEWLEWLDPAAFSHQANYRDSDSGSCLGGVMIRQSVVVNMPAYLRGIWAALQQEVARAATWHEVYVGGDLLTLLEGDSPHLYDAIVLASGGGVRGFPLARSLPVELVRGQTLLFDNSPQTYQPLEHAILCGEYVVPGWDEEARPVLRCGSTREYLPAEATVGPGEEEGGQSTCPTTLEAAEAVLNPKIHPLYPPLDQSRPVAVTSGIRVNTKRSNLGKLPQVGRVQDGGKGQGHVWVYTGLGGRGLIHHAYLGRALAASIATGDPTAFLPPEVMVHQQPTHPPK